MSLSGSFNRNFPMQAQNKQAGVGLLLGEHRDSQIVAVKQVVPRGSADRAGRIRAGDQVVPRGSADRAGRIRAGDPILKVGETEARGLGVNELRNYIIGDQGSTVRITFKREDSDEMYELDLIRGTPEYFDGMAGAPQQLDLIRGTPEYLDAMAGAPQQQGHMQQMQGSQQMQGGQGQGQGGSLYASGNRMQNLNRYMLGTSWSAEMFAQMPPPQQQQMEYTERALRMAESTIKLSNKSIMEYNPERALSEENEWLRNALRMAESTIMRSRTDLAFPELFPQSKSESESAAQTR
ncbi:hypothetical protein T484DRAFT_1812010 [Baffinella frigidus]|nr:hypothetical protein T484DRAFT_1812010 [Cryptophyta sp. CCMP2293]